MASAVTSAGSLLHEAYLSLPCPTDAGDRPVYAARGIREHPRYFVGKDLHGRACLLVLTQGATAPRPAPIRLENLDAHFDVHCVLRREDGSQLEDSFTVLRCRATDGLTTGYFLSVCELLIKILRDAPSQSDVVLAVGRLAALFQKLRNPPKESLDGLFGELYVIVRSSDPIATLRSWRVDPSARFDFLWGALRLDVKATTGRVRSHVFSYDQCNPPQGSVAVAVSILVERVAVGLSLATLVAALEDVLGQHVDLILKLHDVLADTLGSTLPDALHVSFDAKLAESSRAFFDMRAVPAIRGELPMGIADVRFRSDLTALVPLTDDELAALHPDLSYFS